MATTMEYYRFHAQCYIAFILGTCRWSYECYRGYIVLYCHVCFSWWLDKARSGARCHAPNRFGTVNMEDNVYIEWSWCEGWVQWNLIVAIYRTRRLSWCKRWLPTSSSHHSHKNHQEAEETEGITSILNNQRSWRIDGETNEKEKKWFLAPKCHF